MWSVYLFLFFFFFQAEDGIRDTSVTGVQTCALPICDGEEEGLPARRGARVRATPLPHHHALPPGARLRRAGLRGRRDDRLRSEERRVGKECRSRWGRYEHKRKEIRAQVTASQKCVEA